ncbi:MAG: S41 family peptidase [candidate division KSB1 bacterium]|nr:S41 family peptidase [candidate division KSB1 bacterium]
MKRHTSRMKLGLVSFGTILLISLFSTILMDSRAPQSVWAYGESIHEKLRILRMLIDTIQRSYVEERSLEELMEGAIHGMLERLDPHTNYLPPDNFQRWNKAFEGFTGIGIYFSMVAGWPMITGFVENSPAEKSTLQSGDIIEAIDGHSTRGMTRVEIEEALMGTPFDAIELTVLRRQDKIRRQRVRIARSHLNINSIDGAYMLTDGVGYISLTRFTGMTASELDEALEILTQKGMRALVLDLRDNGGGYLSAAVAVADRFLPKGTLIVFSKGRLERSFQEYRANGTFPYEKLPVVVLLNHGTASAAEIVAGALQDWDRALIVGTTSFGKGLVQSQYRFSDGSALLVTTAKYYTPLGRCIQRDYFGMSKDQYYAAAYLNESPQTSREHATEVFKTPLGRKVFGGGGIIPDVWADNHSADAAEVVRELYFSAGNVFFDFASRLLRQKPYLRSYPPQRFASLSISDDEFQEFERFLRKNHVDVGMKTLRQHASDIKFLLKRELAYLAGGPEARFWVNYQRDAQLQAAAGHIFDAELLLQREAVAQVLKQRD